MKGICRLCLANVAEFYIFSESSTTHEKLLSYCKLEIYKDDGLPDEVCCFCLQQLDVVVDFINKCEESDKVLRKEISNKQVKNSNIAIKKEYNKESVETLSKYSENDEIECEVKNLGPETLQINVAVKDELEYYADIFSMPLHSSIDKIKKFSSCDLARPLNSKTKIRKHSKARVDKIILSKKHVTRNPSKIKNRYKKKIKGKPIKSEDEALLTDDQLNTSDLDKDSPEYDESKQVLKKRLAKSKMSLSKLKGISRKRKDPNLKDAIRKASRRSKFEDESSLCPVCGKWFPQSRALRQHLQKHSGIIHKCGKCPKTFSTRELMKVHEQRHLRIRGFPCEVCGSTFSSSYLSRKHFQLVHQRIKAVACKVCDKVLCNARGLNEHMKIHTGERSFECQLCQKKFAHKLSLTCHIRVHTGEQPYACSFCEKRFSIGKSLKEHERLHTGEKPYGCPLCPKRFEQLSNMKSHFRYNHKGLDFKKTRELTAAANVDSIK